MIQIILAILIIIIMAILVAAIVMKKAYSVSASVIINKSQAEVFNYIVLLKNQEFYSKWVMADPNVKLVYTGIDGTIGFKAAWNSLDKNVGVGEQEIVKIDDGVGYYVELRFEKPFKGISQANTLTKDLGNSQTQVTTTFDTKTPFPMNIMIPLIKNMLTKDMNTNMNNLKSVLEN